MEEKIPSWKKYEKYIFYQFKKLYPNPEINIKSDVKLVGIQSGRKRQIDILITGNIADNEIKIVVDCKYFNKKVNVKIIESFIGMMQDLKCHKSIIISNEGFTESAIARVKNLDKDIDLRTILYKDLEKFQGFGGFLYSLNYGVLFDTPPYWLVDVKKHHQKINAFLIPVGIDFQRAIPEGKFMYLEIVEKIKGDLITNIDDIIKYQEESTRVKFSSAQFDYNFKLFNYDRNPIKFRKIKYREYPFEEFTCFVDFGEFIYYCVLNTPTELKKEYLKALEYLIKMTVPAKIYNINKL